MAQPHVLIADDEPLILSALSGFLKGQAWHVETALNGKDALIRLQKQRFDVAVLDMQMPFLDGIGVLKAVVAQKIDTDVLMMTAFGSVESTVDAMHKGAKDFLLKPINRVEFIAKIQPWISARYPLAHILVERLDAFLVANLERPDLNLQVLVNHFGLSKSYIARLFKTLSTSFSERLACHRVEKAKVLLLNTNEPMYVIAELCGFRQPRRLSEVFLRMTGIAPRRFRQLNRPDFVDL